jgi:hypothetical protein
MLTSISTFLFLPLHGDFLHCSATYPSYALSQAAVGTKQQAQRTKQPLGQSSRHKGADHRIRRGLLLSTLVCFEADQRSYITSSDSVVIEQSSRWDKAEAEEQRSRPPNQNQKRSASLCLLLCSNTSSDSDSDSDSDSQYRR